MIFFVFFFILFSCYVVVSSLKPESKQAYFIFLGIILVIKVLAMIE